MTGLLMPTQTFWQYPLVWYVYEPWSDIPPEEEKHPLKII